MTRSVEDRADRLMRRRYGWFDRRAMSWSVIQRDVAAHDATRELRRAWGVAQPPDPDALRRTIVGVGRIWISFVLALLFVMTLVYGPTWWLPR